MTSCLVRPATPTWSLFVSSSTNVAMAGWGSSALPSQTTPWWRRPLVCLLYKLYVHVAQHAHYFRVWSENPERPNENGKLISDRCNAQADMWLMMCSFFPVLSTMMRNCKLSQLCLKPHACIQVIFLFIYSIIKHLCWAFDAPCCSINHCESLCDFAQATTSDIHT